MVGFGRQIRSGNGTDDKPVRTSWSSSRFRRMEDQSTFDATSLQERRRFTGTSSSSRTKKRMASVALMASLGFFALFLSPDDIKAWGNGILSFDTKSNKRSLQVDSTPLGGQQCNLQQGEDKKSTGVVSAYAGTESYGDNGRVAVHGNYMAAGASYGDIGIGEVKIFSRASGDNWIEEAVITASDGAVGDNFGSSVALHLDTLVVGADLDGNSAGAVYIFLRDINTGAWNEVAKLTEPSGAVNSKFGHAIAIKSNTLIVGAWSHSTDGVESGRAFVYNRSGSDWSLHQVLNNPGSAPQYDRFGWSVDVSDDQSTIVVGAWGADDNGMASGKAYVYANGYWPEYGSGGLGASWYLEETLLATDTADGNADDQLGRSVAVSDDGWVIVAGAHRDDNSGLDDTGSAYVFKRYVYTPEPTMSPTSAPTSSALEIFPIAAYSSSQESSEYGPENALDGSVSARWSSCVPTCESTHWWDADLGNQYYLKQVFINWETAHAEDYRIQVSNDRISWTDAYVENGKSNDWDTTIDLSNVAAAQGVRYVRIYTTKKSAYGNVSFYIFRAYGTLALTPTPEPTLPPVSAPISAPSNPGPTGYQDSGNCPALPAFSTTPTCTTDSDCGNCQSCSGGVCAFTSASKTMTVTVVPDTYPEEILWRVDGPGVRQESQSTSTFPVCGGETYTINIYDGYGDGLYDPGYYKVEVDGVTYATGGGAYGDQYTCTQAKTFLVTARRRLLASSSPMPLDDSLSSNRQISGEHDNGVEILKASPQQIKERTSNDVTETANPFTSTSRKLRQQQEELLRPEHRALQYAEGIIVTWQQQQRLAPTIHQSRPHDNFGASVAIGGGDNTIVIGAPGDLDGIQSESGSTYVYAQENNAVPDAISYDNAETWALQHKLLIADNPYAGDRFGGSVAYDGNTVVVGSFGVDGNEITQPKDGYAYIYNCPPIVVGGSNAVQYEAEDADFFVDYDMKTNQVLFVGVNIKTEYTGYTGNGYAEFRGPGMWLEWKDIYMESSGTCTFDFRYALGGTSPTRSCMLMINGVQASMLHFPHTGSWATWSNMVVSTTCNAGNNDVRVVVSNDVGGPLLDNVQIAHGGTSNEIIAPTPSPTQQPYGPPPDEEKVPGEYVLEVSDSSQCGSIVSQYGGTLISSRGKSCTAAFGSDSQANNAIGDARVGGVGSNYKVFSRAVIGFGVIDKNPMNWGLQRISARGLKSGAYVYIHDGHMIDIFVLDTGINMNHEEFAGRLGPKKTCIGNPSDVGTHGTWAASLAAGVSYGVARRSMIHSVQVLDSNGEGTVDSILCGIDYVMQQKAANTGYRSFKAVVLMSAGVNGKIQALDDAVTMLTNNGISVAIGAGNNNANACNYSPYSPGAFMVGSIDDMSANVNPRSSFSNYGSCLTFFAPGSDMMGASSTGTNGYTITGGTSASAAFTAGAISLVLSEYSIPHVINAAEVKERVLKRTERGSVIGAGAGSPNEILQTTSSMCNSNSDCKPGYTCGFDGNCV